jgi:two-component system, sensor histidine kinase YesM
MKKSTFLDNYKIKTKLLFIYIFCVMIPMLATDAAIVAFVSYYSNREQQENLENQLESIEYSLTMAIDNCISVSKDLYMDKVLNRFLNTKFENPFDYFDHYNALLQNNLIRYYYTSQRIYDVSIYINNKTLINGGHFFRLDEARETNWYKAFQKSPNNMISYVYFDESKKYLPSRGSARTVSVIRTLDYFEKDGKEKLIKIDLDYNTLLRDIANTQFNEKVYICNDDYILFTNQEVGVGYKQFDSINTIDINQASITSPINILSQEWKVYIMAGHINLWSQLKESIGIIILLIIINLLLPTIVIIFIDKSLRQRVELTGEYMKKVKKEQFEIIDCNTGEDEIGQLIKNYNRMILKIKELIEVVFKGKMERQELQLAKKEAELTALQSQINPHFLFNILESIRMRSLIKKENETADIIGELSILMRRSIHWGKDRITISEEMAFVENYLKLQKYRFGEKLTFSFHIMEECKKVLIPKLSIVTFVENACVHGIEEKSQNGEISVIVSRNYKDLLIKISDSGSGMTKDTVELLTDRLEHSCVSMLNDTKSTGMLNVFIRLKLYFNGQIRFKIESEEDRGTDITLQLPFDELGGMKNVKGYDCR